ncbi:DUF805 domain-containing protein [Ideonella sp. YS5]|uniref:DUF805 domain-containing protein n=1 Tax=Ideonella sp. YS5 TaxID=3453714 RepID=UPI003EECFB92
MEGTVQLIYSGEVLEGFSADDVRRRLGELFKLDETRLAAMFSGSQVVVKRGLSPELARHWVAQFQAMGARLHMQQVVSSVPDTVAQPMAKARDPLAPAPAAIVVNTLPPTEEITCPNCGERQPKRILCRSCATDMPRAIAAREEEAAAERALRREQALARRGVRSTSTHASSRFSASVDTSDGDAPLFGLSFSGRISRMRHLLGSLLNLALLVWLLILVGLAPGRLTGMLLVLGLAFSVVWGCRLTALRLHDTNHSAWWLLLMFVPYLNVIFGLVLLLWPGEDGDNEHGSPPQADDSIPAVGALVVLCLSVALGWSMVSSALQRQFAEFRDSAQAEEQADAEEPALPAQELRRVLHSDEAVGEFHRYMGAPGHRAFAVSGSGAWGWHSGAARPDQAAETALADCERRRPPYTGNCRLVHLNDQWAMN